MALIDSEGFGLSTSIANYFTYSAFQQIGTQVGTITAGGPLGDPFHLASTASCGLRRVIATPIANLIVGFRGAFNSDGSSLGVVNFRNASGVLLFQVQVSVTGQISVYAGDETTLLGGPTAAGTVPVTSLTDYPGTALSWSFVEIQGVISATVGAVTVRVDGVAVLTLTGLNTNINAGTALTGLIDWGDASGGGTMQNGLAHIYISDTTGAAPWNTFLGDVRVQTLRPSANDAVQFTPTGLASNYQNVALTLPVSADYNASATVGQQDTFVMGTLAPTIGIVYGVNVKPLLLKSDAGAKSAASVLKSGATTTVGPTVVLATTARQYRSIYQTDPNTSAAWTLAAAGAVKGGYKVIA